MNGGKWTHIIDATGEILYDRPMQVQINQTLKVALSIAHAALAQSSAATVDLKAYIKPTYPFYDHSSSSDSGLLEANESGWKPLGIRGTWWHETLRALGNIGGLPLVVTRLAYLYGPNTISTEGMFVTLHPHPRSTASLPTYVMTTRIVTVVPALIFVGYSYKQNAEDMKYLWSSKLRKHTVHSEDAAGAIWACAE